jgi:2-desacetyl-2-hydroxyethyl bacteriochlorophyllide A dehydrogenase
MIYIDGDFRIAPAALPGHRLTYPGHEVVGEVIEVGDEVRHLQVGDRVALQSGPNCITSGAQSICRSCAAGHYSLCERASLLSGPEPIGGGWSEEMLVHEQQLFRISPGMNDEQAVLLEPSAVAVHAVLRRLPQPDDHVLIIGAGTIGLLTLQVIHALVPSATVSVMARYPFQIEQATRMGAKHILYRQDSYQEVERTTGAKLFTGRLNNKMLLGGYEVIYDTIGSKQTIHDSLRWARAGGTVVLVGLNLHTMRLDLTPIWYQEIDLIGTLAHGMENWPIGTYDQCSTFSIAAEMMENELIHPEKLITHRFPLTSYRAAFSTATAKSRSRAIKVLFDYALLPASVVPNVRASARQRHPVTTAAVWPQEQLITHEETNLAPAPDEYPVQPASPAAPEPIEIPVPMPQSSSEELEEAHQFLIEEQTEQIPSIPPSTEEQPEQVPSFSTVEQSAQITSTPTVEQSEQVLSMPIEEQSEQISSTSTEEQTSQVLSVPTVEEPEQIPSMPIEEQSEQISSVPTEEQPEQAPLILIEEQARFEDQRKTNTPVNSKRKRSRQSTKSQKKTEDRQALAEAIGNTTATNETPGTLEE